MFIPSLPAAWLAFCAAAMAALPAAAQPTPEAAVPAALPYKSAFDNYQRFADEKPMAWREANDAVHARGGGGHAHAPGAHASHGGHGGEGGEGDHSGHAGHAMPPPSPEAGK